MTEDTDLTIDIDAPEDTAVETTKPDKTPAVAAERPEGDGVDALKTQLETLTQAQQAERARADRAEGEALRLRNHVEQQASEINRARTETQDSQLSAIDNAITAAQAEAAAAEQEYKSAFEGGDSAKAAAAQRKLARAEARVVQFEGAKADLETRKPEPPQRTEGAVRPVQQPPADPFEAAIAGATPRTQAWLRNHRDYVTDPKMNQKANAAHLMALSEDFVPDTDGYFARCEEILGLRQPADDEPAPRPKPRTRTAMPAAPVSRDASPSNGNLGAGKIVLSPGEQRNATDGTIVWNHDDPNGKFKKGDPIGLHEMARRKASMTTEGRYATSYTDQ